MKKQANALLAGMLFSGLTMAHSVPDGPAVVPLDAMLGSVGWSFDDPVTTQELAKGFYVMYGVGGNIVVSSGEDGVLIVDDQFPEMWPSLKKAMRKQGDTDIDFVVNTHWHFDHADGNMALGKNDSTWIVSQSNSREMMLSDHVINLVAASIAQPAYPKHALPSITFDTTMQFHLNGQQIDLLHAGPAHTTGDAAVFFRGNNAVHLGDVFNNAGYPFIDADNGGSLDGVISFCEAVLLELNADSVVIPGHGPVAGYSDLVAYVDMLKKIREQLVILIKSGSRLEEIQKVGVTKVWDEKMGDSVQFINRSYTSLTSKYLP